MHILVLAKQLTWYPNFESFNTEVPDLLFFNTKIPILFFKPQLEASLKVSLVIGFYNNVIIVQIVKKDKPFGV